MTLNTLDTTLTACEAGDILTAPQFDLMSALELDDDARDQIGTFVVALFVAALATLARVAVQRKNRWWFNMLLMHGAILVYWFKQCHLNEPQNPWLTTIHGGLCWRNAAGEFQQIAFWGGDRERLILNGLVWLAVLGNVIPAYATGNEAGRHMTHVKRRACNPLINHVIAGILCVVFPFFVVTFRWNVAVPIAVILDLYHQITIHRLIANHDGIWVLRAVSMSLAITKWIVILNMYTTDAVGMLDQIFIMSTGFLGTRAYGATAYILYYLGLGDIKTAQWYSIGLMTANNMILGRCWGQMRIAFWLTVVNCAAVHYHQMWKKYLHLRPAFVLMCCVMTATMAHSGTFLSLMFTIVWGFAGFMLPHFNRFRPAPPKDEIYTPSVSTRPESGFLVGKPMCPMGFTSSSRTAGFLGTPNLKNSRKIKSDSARQSSVFAFGDPLTPNPDFEEYCTTPHSARSLLPPTPTRSLSMRSLFQNVTQTSRSARNLIRRQSLRTPVAPISEGIEDEGLVELQSSKTSSENLNKSNGLDSTEQADSPTVELPSPPLVAPAGGKTADDLPKSGAQAKSPRSS